MSESAEESQRSGSNRDGTEGGGRSKQVERRIGPVDRRLSSAVKKMAQDLQNLASAAEEAAVGQLLAATARVDGETTQSGILTALLEEGRRFASRTAFFLTRPGEVRGWAGLGFSNVEGARLDYQEGSVWARMAAQTGALSLDAEECAVVCRGIDAPAGSSGVLIPFTLRGQLGGMLYADRAEGEDALAIASLQLLTHAAAQTVETTAQRGGASSPALHSSLEATKPVSVWQPPAEAEPAPEPEASKPPVAEAATAVAAAAAAGVAAVADAVVPTEEPEEPDVVEEPAVVDEPAVVEEPAVAEEPDVADVVDEPEAAAPTDQDEAVAEDAPAAAVEEAPAAAVEEAPVAAVEEAPAAAVSEAAAGEEAAVEEPDGAEAVDFEMVSTAEVEEDLQAVEDIEAELEPEPELEDTSDLWAVEEDEAEPEEEEATFVGQAPVAELPSEPEVAEPAIAEPPAAPAIEQPRPPGIVPPEVGQETVRLDIAALQGQMPPAPVEPVVEEETAGVPPTELPQTELPQWEVEAAPEPQEFELEPEDEPAPPAPAYEIEEPATTPMAAPDFSEDATMISPPREPVTPDPSPMAGGYVPPAPAAPSTEVKPPADMAPPSTEVKPPADMAPSTEVTPPPSSGFAAPPPQKPDATGTSQVVPPTDIQGPGSAFGASADGAIPEGEEALHEEARRLARLLVSEIKLYNEEIIEEGRRTGNIYDRLKDDIDRSRQMYEERIDPRLLEGDHDYFRQELVQRLAGGDERLLGY